MKTSFWILLCFFSLSKSMLGQNHIEIEGKILDKETKEPIPFANIYNKSSKKGTISNADGYFRILINEVTDTITISFIGYKEQIIKIKADKKNYLIYLEVNILLLNEVTVTPKDNSYLFELVQASKKSISSIERKSKAYYELKSYVDVSQIELVEGYYNIDVKGYSLMNLHLKAGRIALSTNRNSFFVSLESSRALLMLNLFDRNDYFPINPMELSKSKLRKNYYLDLESKYLDGTNDSIYIIDYKPKDTTGLFFYGKIWINKTKNHLIKITLNCANTLKHPFLPLNLMDKISNVSFNITQSFSTSNGQVVFNHTDFIYKTDYVSRIGITEEQKYTVLTKAVLYAYDYENSFNLPFFNFKDFNIGDYQKINAMPYNDFFWTYNDEYRLNDSINTNELFFIDSSSLTNKTLFKSNTFFKYGLFEHPYISWSRNRIKFREILSDTSVAYSATGFKSEQYKLAVKIYLDINSYRDSTHIITSTIIDPYESYYHLPMNNQTLCFINIYFDLCEIARRELEEKLKAQTNNVYRLKEIYNNFLTQFETKRNEYLKAVEHGTIEKEMIKYNNIVYEILRIDNIGLFQPYKNEK
ncbi:MAG: carboxypeptidase-like regulatory domain-containing protein [Saprospiraceae bacterium]|nr:carboxypeptidase-like regulatory domain-containing protein [Saprospiraceae bacterium]